MLPPREVEARAAESLQFIRDTMASASAFTAVSGKGAVLMGMTACAAAAVAHRQPTTETWLLTWLGAAAAAIAIGALAIALKARRAGAPLLTGSGRRFLWSFVAPLVAGAVLTVALYAASASHLLPGTWLLLYGTAAIAGSAASIEPTRRAGACFMALGTLALLAPAGWADTLMAAGFGGIHIVFGIVIARRYGG